MTFVPSYVDHRFAGVTRWFLANDCELGGRHIVDAFDRYATLGQRLMHIFWAIIAFLPIGGLFLSLKEKRWAKEFPKIASNKGVSRNYWAAHPKERKALGALLDLFARKKVTMHHYRQLASVGIPKEAKEVRTLFTLFIRGKITVEGYRQFQRVAKEESRIRLEGLTCLLEEGVLTLGDFREIKSLNLLTYYAISRLNSCLPEALNRQKNPTAGPANFSWLAPIFAELVLDRTIAIREFIEMDPSTSYNFCFLSFYAVREMKDLVLKFFRKVQNCPASIAEIHADFYRKMTTFRENFTGTEEEKKAGLVRLTRQTLEEKLGSEATTSASGIGQ